MRKNVLITGASRGIGAAIARTFYDDGYRLALHYHQSEQAMRALLQDMNQTDLRAIGYAADIADRQQVQTFVQQALGFFGGFDTVICNAGIAQSALLTDMSPEDVQRLIQVNLCGVIYTVQAVLPSMLAQGSGNIIILSSMWGTVGACMESVYAATKAGVEGLMKSLAKEAAPFVRVNAIAPGFIDTDMTSQYTEAERAEIVAQIPLQRSGKPEEVAQVARFLASDAAAYITGQVIHINGGMVIGR